MLHVTRNAREYVTSNWKLIFILKTVKSKKNMAYSESRRAQGGTIMKAEVYEAMEKVVLEGCDQIDTSVPIGSEEYESTMRPINEAFKNLNEADKIRADAELKKEEVRAQFVSDLLKFGTSAMTVVLQVGAGMLLAVGILKFEETGTLRSKAWTMAATKILKL